MIGEVKQIVSNNIPKGWLLCDGSTVSIKGNERLFEEIGFNYGGEGDFFNLPDFTGRVLVCASDLFPMGSNGGSVNSSINLENIPSHSHDLKNGNAKTIVKCASSYNVTNEVDEGNNLLGTGLSMPDIYRETENGYENLGGVEISGKTEENGGGKPISIMQPYAVVNFIINVDDE